MDNREITLSDLFEMATKWLWLLLIGMIVVGSAAFYYSKFCVTPLYSSTSKFYVQTKQQESQQISVLDDQRSVVYAQTVVSGYIEVLDTYYFSNELSYYLDGNVRAGDSPKKLESLKAAGNVSEKYSGKALKRMLTFTTKEQSAAFSVQVTCKNAEDAQIIAEYIEIIMPDYIDEKAPGAGVISIIDGALPSNGSINNKTLLSTLLGIIIGAIFAFAIAFIIDINDTRVKSEKELSEIFMLPVIGAIPDCAMVQSSDYISETAQKQKR